MLVDTSSTVKSVHIVYFYVPLKWLLYVHMYIVPARVHALMPSTQERGPERSPFLFHPCGDFYFFDRVEGSNMYIMYIVPAALPALPTSASKGDPNGPLF